MNQSWHEEKHFSNRNNWLRASVLGANDGLISTASLLMGLAAAEPNHQTLLITGIAALVSGAVSMAAGEYVSVSSQRDTEAADLRKELDSLTRYPEIELAELTDIYRQRGLNQTLAQQVAEALTKHNALEAHAREEIGITEVSKANPLQAAMASAFSFACGALLPVLLSLLSSTVWLMSTLAVTTVIGLGILGCISAHLGGAPKRPAVIRIIILGALALAFTSMIGRIIGITI
ncbi:MULTISPECIES: VIT family protein [Snodgrassella]|uniref:VIT1/CCC1 transporter family protein n=1 Tax=Snodgrassella TaxID=1193515 RepID=UPI00226A1A60|nr:MULTISPECIES: VIT family protein [unclassified Snodgrassella]MCX8749205.1 VIT family protein [Snodgrassella sp. B3088]MCX8753904.1 VIT family protein [Snodgrassella sp. B3837]